MGYKTGIFYVLCQKKNTFIPCYFGTVWVYISFLSPSVTVFEAYLVIGIWSDCVIFRNVVCKNGKQKFTFDCKNCMKHMLSIIFKVVLEWWLFSVKICKNSSIEYWIVALVMLKGYFWRKNQTNLPQIQKSNCYIA